MGRGRGKQRGSLRRKPPKRAPHDRVLIVCEGSKTEPNYFQEIRQLKRLRAVDCRIVHCSTGTAPKQIVEFAEKEFHKSKGYDKIFVVFDRDTHDTYANAIKMAEARNGKYKNDEKKHVSFEAVTSVPCFEIWLLIHFSDIQTYLNSDDALNRLKAHLPGYQKGKVGTFAMTSAFLDDASTRGSNLKNRFKRLPGDDPYTDVQDLIAVLMSLA